MITQESAVTGSGEEFYCHELRTAENCQSGRSCKTHLNLGSNNSDTPRAAFSDGSANSDI